VCIGINFAYMEATYVLALLLGRYRLELAPGWELRPAYVFNVILDGGLPVTVTEASSGSTVNSAG
jgi:cytochrome P450